MRSPAAKCKRKNRHGAERKPAQIRKKTNTEREDDREKTSTVQEENQHGGKEKSGPARYETGSARDVERIDGRSKSASCKPLLCSKPGQNRHGKENQKRSCRPYGSAKISRVGKYQEGPKRPPASILVQISGVSNGQGSGAGGILGGGWR